jgi:NAD(P) transhydrogenase subunit alpha
VIATAQIPGKKAPLLLTEDTVKKMKAGAVVVDLAASTGGNCELTENDKTIQAHNVTIIGKSNFPASLPVSASLMYAKNVMNFLKLLIDEENNLKLDFEDDLVKGTCVTHQGEIISERIKNVYENQ